MTQTQRELLLKAVEELVSEHCHGFIFAAEVDCDDPSFSNQNESGMVVVWNGGLTLATGLAARLLRQLTYGDLSSWEN